MSNQLVKKNHVEGYQNVFPKTFIDAIKDKESGVSLQEILQGFNMYFLSYNESRALTRCKVPSILRKEGLWITYVLYDHTVVTEWYNSDQIDDNSWSMDSNWRVASNNLVGDVSVSADGYWVINGEKTEAKAQGEQGVTPLLRVGPNNKLQVSYNAGKAWRDISDYIVPRFRWNQGAGTSAGNVQISMDLGKTWTNLSNGITNNLRISRYIGINESLPTSGVAEGTVYMKGPYYDEGDTSNANPIYRMWIYAWKDSTLAWQDNGEFTSINAGVVQERGNSTTEVMSQDAVTRELTELESETEIISASRPIAEGNNGNMIPYDIIIDNHYYDTTTGIKTYSANWKCTPMIPIKPNISFAKSVILQINEFDKDFNHIRYIAQADTTFTSSENAAYVTGSFNNQFKETARFNEGETLNDWVEGEKLFLIRQVKGLPTRLDEIESVAKTARQISTENKELLTDMITSGIQLFDAQFSEIVTGEFINYDSGEISNGASYEWLKIAVDSSKGYITTSGATNLHIAFFNNEDNYISGVLVSWNEPTKTFAIPANAALMSISVRIADASALMVEYGQSASVYTPYSQVIKESYLPKVEGKREIFVAKGQSILSALKKYATDVRVIVESGVYNMVAEYKAYYGEDFFAKYDGYAKHYDDLFYAGYYLGDGVELIGQGDVTIQFDYNEGSKDADSASPVFDAVAQYFSPINTSQNNIVRNINIAIGYDYSCRYHVHDDFATKAGNNVFQNMTLRGRSSKFTSFGCGMGTANTYILENICILTGDGYSISYHNSSSAGKNKLIIKDCYCEGNIMARMMGLSTEKTEVLVSGCKAAAIVLNFVDQENQPNENMELIQWNNIVG